MRTHVAVNTVRHFLVHGGCMRLTMTGTALRYTRMLITVTEGTGECLVLSCGFFHLYPNLFMAWNTEGPRRCHGRRYLQRVMRRMTAKTVTGDLAGGMRFMTLGAVRDLAVHIMTEGAGLLGMGGLIIGEILARTFVTRETRFLDVIGKIQGQRFMRVGMAR